MKVTSPRGFATLTAGFGARRTPAEFDFRITPLGPIMSSKDGEPYEAWGVVNPIEIAAGWLLTYHGVSNVDGHLKYCMGVASLDTDRPNRVLCRTPLPILEPETDHERRGLTSTVVFPSATDLRPNGELDVYYGAADRIIAVARMRLPGEAQPPSSRAVRRHNAPTTVTP